MSAVSLAMSISKAAMKLVKTGQAIVSSGGVRLLDGTMFEMAKPMVSSGLKATLGNLALGPVGGGLNIASSLASNVQCAIIQQGVNAANIKLDDVVQRLGRLETAMQGLQSIQVLSWANTALSLANSGISIVGFYMTLTKLNHIEEQLKAFFDRYQQDRNGDAVEQFRAILLDLKNDLNYLQNKLINNTFDDDSFVHRESVIEEHFNKAAAFIKRILTEFMEERIDGRIGCQIIFVLSAIYAQTVNEYCCQYYYVHHLSHNLFSDWTAVLDEIDAPAFKEYLKRYFTFAPEYADVSPVRKNDAVKVALESVSEHRNRLSACNEMIKLMPESEFIRVDDLLNHGIYTVIEQRFPLLTDAYLTEQIKKVEIDKSSDFITLEIPQ